MVSVTINHEVVGRFVERAFDRVFDGVLAMSNGFAGLCGREPQLMRIPAQVALEPLAVFHQHLPASEYASLLPASATTAGAFGIDQSVETDFDFFSGLFSGHGLLFALLVAFFFAASFCWFLERAFARWQQVQSSPLSPAPVLSFSPITTTIDQDPVEVVSRPLYKQTDSQTDCQPELPPTPSYKHTDTQTDTPSEVQKPCHEDADTQTDDLDSTPAPSSSDLSDILDIIVADLDILEGKGEACKDNKGRIKSDNWVNEICPAAFASLLHHLRVDFALLDPSLALLFTIIIEKLVDGAMSVRMWKDKRHRGGLSESVQQKIWELEDELELRANLLTTLISAGQRNTALDHTTEALVPWLRAASEQEDAMTRVQSPEEIEEAGRRRMAVVPPPTPVERKAHKTEPAVAQTRPQAPEEVASAAADGVRVQMPSSPAREERAKAEVPKAGGLSASRWATSQQ